MGHMKAFYSNAYKPIGVCTWSLFDWIHPAPLSLSVFFISCEGKKKKRKKGTSTRSGGRE